MILVEVSDATKANTSMQMQASDPMPCTNPLTELKAAESAAGLAPGSICGGGCPSLVDARGSRCRFNDERGTDALPRLRLVPRFARLHSWRHENHKLLVATKVLLLLYASSCTAMILLAFGR